MDNEVKTNKILKIVLAGLVGVAVALVVALLIVMLNKPSRTTATLESVKAFCEGNNMNVEEGVGNDMNYVSCWAINGDIEAGEIETTSIMFGVYDEPVMGQSDYAEARESFENMGAVIAEGDGYIKLLVLSGDDGQTVSYLVIDGKMYLQVAAPSDEAARGILAGLGYPDKDWPSDENWAEASRTVATMQADQRDMQRQNDMARLANALTRYQANNGALTGPLYWEGNIDDDCASGNAVCKLVANYLVAGGGEFMDPDGEVYNVYVSENLAENGILTTNHGNDYSELMMASEDQYTIGGEDAFGQRIAYVVPGSKCSEDDEDGVIASETNEYSVMYKLENGNVFCTNGL